MFNAIVSKGQLSNTIENNDMDLMHANEVEDEVTAGGIRKDLEGSRPAFRFSIEDTGPCHSSLMT